MRVIIAGSRSVTKENVRTAIRHCPWRFFITSVVSGTAKGADYYGEEIAAKSNLNIIRYPANWKKYGKKAGPLRNEEMAKNAEGLIAIWDGTSRGTRSMIELAEKYGLNIFLFNTSENQFKTIPPRGQCKLLWQALENRYDLLVEKGTDKEKATKMAGEITVSNWLADKDFLPKIN